VIAAACGSDHLETEEQLDRLARVHRFVHRVAEIELPDGTFTSRYRFTHVLYQNQLYDSLIPARRRSISGDVGRALERSYSTQAFEIAPRLAALYETARDFSRAADFFLLGARRAAGTLRKRGSGCTRSSEPRLPFAFARQ
jgi:hypothetical protein